MIPIYPAFRQIEKEDKAVFELAFKRYPPRISEFTFTNLFAWREAYKFQLSKLDGLLIICFELSEKKRFLCPIGEGNLRGTIERILKDRNGEFVRLPEEAKELLVNEPAFIPTLQNRGLRAADGVGRDSAPKGREEKELQALARVGFTIEPDRDNADYLYKTRDLIELKGQKYDAKRNFIKKFRARNEYEYVKLRPENIQECLDFEECWCSAKLCDTIQSLSDERQAFKIMLANFSEFNLVGGAIRIRGKVEAVVLAEALNPDTLVLHIMKADPDIEGLYQTILNEFLGREARGFEYVNMEQDLGVPGLRKSKLSYQPCQLLMKYTLRAK